MKDRKKDRPELFYGIALANAVSARFLDEKIRQLSDPGNTRDDKDIIVGSHRLSSTLLNTICVELILKSMSYGEKGTYDASHDLNRLYDALGENTKSLIRDSIGSRIEKFAGIGHLADDALSVVLDIMRQVKDAFVESRYQPINEKETIERSWLFTSALREIMLDAYEKVAAT